MRVAAWKSRVVNAVLNLLRQGITPQKLALTIAIGIGVGTFPILGITTILCTVAAIVLRLNLPAMQTTNYCAYPLQLALMFPFAHLGAKLLRATPIPFAPSGVNEVNHGHVITATVTVNNGSGLAPAPDGTVVTFSTGGPGTFNSTTCPTSGGTRRIRLRPRATTFLRVRRGQGRRRPMRKFG